jgi:hypothetical protein
MKSINRRQNISCMRKQRPHPPPRAKAASPLDVPCIVTQARTADILAAIKESRTDKARI